MAAQFSLERCLRLKIFMFAVLSRVALILLQMVFNALIPDHEANVFNPPSKHRNKMTEIQSVFDFFLSGFNRWDAIYFTFITQYGYTYENTLAFFPLCPLLARTLANSVFYPFQSILSYDQVILLSWLALNTLIFIKSADCLFTLGQMITKNDYVAYKAALLFCLNPASIFMIAPYSEAVFTYLSLQGLVKLETGKIFQASVYFGLGCATRSNGLLNLGFLLYRVSHTIKENFKRIKSGIMTNFMTFYSSLWVFFVFSIVPSCVCILTSLLPFLMYQYYCYASYCKEQYSLILPGHVRDYGQSEGLKMFGASPSSWCHDPIPLAYSYIQRHYWDQGFLRYWQLKQLPNFLLAVPVTGLVLYTAKTFYFNNRHICLTLGFGDTSYLSKKDQAARSFYQLEGVAALPYVIHAIAFTLFAWGCIHIQVLTRLLFSSNPVLYWSAAHLVSKHALTQHQQYNKYDWRQSTVQPVETEENLNRSWTNLLTSQILSYKSQDCATKFVIGYFISYFVIGSALFCNFLPWT